MKKFIAICLALAVACGIILCIKSLGASDSSSADSPRNTQEVKPIAKRTHIAGLDVSHHNGLKSVSDLPDSIKFVYIKASEGKTFKDPAFKKNYNLFAKKAPHKVAVGAYHFFDQEVSAEDQFKNLSAALGTKHFYMPVVVDFEFIHASGRKEKQSIQNNLLRLLQLIEAKYKKNPLIYCNPKGYKLFIGNDKRLAKYGIWLDAKNYNGTVPNAVIEQKKIIDMCNTKIDINYAVTDFVD